MSRLIGSRLIGRIIPIVYVLVGVLIASQNGYFTTLNSLPAFVNALLAILLWPLVLFGVDLHLLS